jgi:RNA polymerase sigma-70 factor (ECF subfamily)
MRTLADEELIRMTLARDERAFAELVRRYQRRVAVTVRSILGDASQEDLADTVQDVFLLVYRGLGSFRGDAQFGTWLTRIALRHCYREAQRQRRRRFLFNPFRRGEDDRDAPEERITGTLRSDAPVLDTERRHAIDAAMAQLPEEFRTVLVLRVVEEMSVEEVAAALEISAGTVKSRLYRAKERMRDLLASSDLELDAIIDEESPGTRS